MAHITVNNSNIISCNEGDNLYKVLSDNGYIFTGNCGMKGLCNRCTVLDTTTGSFIKSCQYDVERDISIELPENRMDIVTNHVLPDNTDNKTVSDNESYGIAVDIGTTTLAMELVDLQGKSVISTYSTLNSQIATGADVVSRIAAASTEEGLASLRKMIYSDIAKGINYFTEHNPEITDSIYKYVFSGNTTMLSILTGITTENLGAYPFELKTKEVCYIPPEDFIENHNLSEYADKDRAIVCLPHISAFVGSDISAGAVACKLDGEAAYNMLIDLGTNGELILCNEQGGAASSTACGPAFEGCFRNKGIYGTNIMDMLTVLRKRGQINTEGILPEAYIEQGISMGGDIVIDMDIIRSFQLAKAAIKTGITILINKLGITYDDINKVYISGGFGFHLNIENAIYLGLLPEEFRDKIVISGNSSLSGAYLSLIEPDFIDTMIAFNKKIRTINFAEEDNFSTLFVDNINF
jgi:uncharacterized 2Fe-2S/4Fe-4S cluster protein (DUF4445 family)